MYLHTEFLTTSRIHDPHGRTEMLFGGNVEAAVLRGRKMRSEAFAKAFRPLGRAVARVWRAVAGYLAEQRALNALRQMDAHTLADIGLSPSDVAFAVKHGHRADTHSVATAATAPAAAANDAVRTAKPRQAA
jgi:uncharacterized protein YjiS (DUF1127 family)